MYVNAIGLGCMGLTHASGLPTPKEEAVEILRKAHDMGYDFYDTAECYTGVNPDGSTAYNEEVVGEAVKPFRKDIILCTKFGVKHMGDHLEFDSSPETIRKSLEGSLKKLQTDYVDIYYQHRIDPKVEPEVVAGVMKELIEEGKIKAWGISETNEEYLRRAHAVCPVTVIENRYSMMARWHENLMPVCKELGITYVAFSPLANGALTGAYQSKKAFGSGEQDFRPDMPQYSEEGIKKTNELLEVVSQIGEKHHATNAQMSLAWMINKYDFIIPIPGSRKLDRLQSNFEAGNVELGQEEVKTIDDKLNTMEFKSIWRSLMIQLDKREAFPFSSNPFGLVYENAITENKENEVQIHPITYQLNGIKIASNIYTPKNYSKDKRYPAIVIAVPNGAVKEQAAGLLWTKTC